MSADAERIGPGALVLIVGPSGAGKDTLIGIASRYCVANPDIVVQSRVVTRPASSSENNANVTPEQFERMAAAGEFALHWRAHGHCYGVSRSVDDHIRQGKVVVVNVSRTVLADARERYRNTLAVLITAPVDVLEARLVARNRSSDGAVEDRLQRAALDGVAAADVVISNIGAAEEHGRSLAKTIAALHQRTRNA
jgi:ribose 1,5-bisphosphokinase